MLSNKSLKYQPKVKTSETKSSWNSGYTISALSVFGESMLNTLSFDTSQKEEVVLLPYARDLYLGNVEALSTYFIPILTSSPIHEDRSVNHSRQSHETIDGMICKTSNVLSFHAVPHIPAALLRERLVELKDDIEGQNTLKNFCKCSFNPIKNGFTGSDAYSNPSKPDFAFLLQCH